MGRVESLCEDSLQSRAGFGYLEKRGVIENTNVSLRKGGCSNGELAFFREDQETETLETALYNFLQHSNTAAAE